MVVHKAHRLHERVHGGRTDKTPTPPAKVLAHRRSLIACRDAHQLLVPEQPRSWLWFEAPDVSREAAELTDQLRIETGVVDRGVDLGPIANDAGVLHQAGCLASAETPYHGWVE